MLAKALQLYQQNYGDTLKLFWAGRQDMSQDSLMEWQEINNLFSRDPHLSSNWRWLGERSDISQLLGSCDALIHVSLYEGLPNVICEAFIAGRPVIASAVCDHPLLVEEGVRGLLCDPLSPESICEAIERFVALPLEKRQEMGCNARHYAEEHLTLQRMVDDYEALLH